MRAPRKQQLYRHANVALLRAAVAPLTHAAVPWPDLEDAGACRAWLEQIWARADFAEAVRQASPSLADRVHAIRSGHSVEAKQVRSAALSTARYLLRSSGRPTPFGLFAGVTPVTLGPRARVRWGENHRAVARADAVWLGDVVARLESCSELLERLDVVINDLAVRRGDRLEVPHGQNRVTVRYSSAVAAVCAAATTPVRFGVLVGKLVEDFAADHTAVRSLLTDLVRQGYLVTSLRAPFTVTDPVDYVVKQLHQAVAEELEAPAPLVRELAVIRADLEHHNGEKADQSAQRARVTGRMRKLSSAGRTPLAVDLLLDCDVQLPAAVATEMELTAGALLRLTRQPAGQPAWRDYHAAFIERYGTGTLVPITSVVDPSTGLGYPAGYPGSIFTPPSLGLSKRDERLLALAWKAMADGSRRVVLTDEDLHALTDEELDERHIPPHVELSGRIHAVSREALDRGDFILTVAPARSAGTLTSRFTPLADGSGLAEVYQEAQAGVEGALRVQMSFGPMYQHAENVCRVPAYLGHLLPLGEHSPSGSDITVDDLAVTATSERLHLVSLSRCQIVEPQVFHALALDKQAPPLARFLAHLPRAFGPGWYQFDWGPHVGLPFLPQVRYRRAVLSPAQWRLTGEDLGHGDWRKSLDEWRQRWNCPRVVELRDADRTLRLSLDEPAHAVLLRRQVSRHGQAILQEAPADRDFGWLDGHAHELAFPLVAVRGAAPSPLLASAPLLADGHG
ncbi:lantibiotic dehydratase, partial [Amycolatopsis rhizosphaerae]